MAENQVKVSYMGALGGQNVFSMTLIQNAYRG